MADSKYLDSGAGGIMARMVSRLVAGLVLVVTAVGCGPPRIRIEWSRPPQLSLAPQTPVALDVEADGTAPVANNVVDVMVGLGQGQLLNKWVAVGPVLAELDAALKGAGHNLVEANDAALTVRVRVTRWSYQVRRGSPGSGRLEARLDVVDQRSPDAPPVFSDGFWATGTGIEPEALGRASRALASAFLRTLQPSRVSARVELDDEDPITSQGINLCKQRQFEAAYLAFSDAATRAPDSAPVLYDLAVLAELRGEYDLAESMLTRATGLRNKSLYYVALERVRRARQDAQALTR